MKFHDAAVKGSFEVRGAAEKIMPPFRMSSIVPLLLSV
jgi:hypothetical protein